MQPSELSRGYTCECGEFQPFGTYVFAHWDIEVAGKCPACNRTTIIRQGEVVKTLERKYEDLPRREKILTCAADLVGALLWEDRKEDEDLPRGEIESAINQKEITVSEIVAEFEKYLTKRIHE